MRILTQSLTVKTRGNTDLIDITDEVRTMLQNSNFIEGSVLIFSGGSTASVTTIEYEPGLLKDYPGFFEKIIPSNQKYQHDETWNDNNGYAHIRASLQGSSLTIPFVNKKLLLGSWQQIIFIDFDNRPRTRNVTIQITGTTSR